MAIIQFDNGQKVEFDGNPTAADVEEVARKLGIGAPAAAPTRSTMQKIQDIPEKATAPVRGFVKEAIDLPRKVAELGLKAGEYAAEKVFGPSGPSAAKTALQEGVRRPEITTPKGTGEKIGAGVEQVAEFFVPAGPGKAGKLAEGASMVSRAAQAFKTAAISALEAGTKTAVQTGGDIGDSSVTAGVSLAVPLATLAFKTPLTAAAEKLYASAAKFTPTATERAASKGIDLVKTALKERVFLTQGGVERVAAKIDDLENMVGKSIDAAKRRGLKISTGGLGAYIDEAKELFKNDFDVSAGRAAIKELDAIKKSFIAKYGKYIPIEKAQEIKVATGQRLAKFYGRLTEAGIEGRKAGTRFLKEKIVEAAPALGDINKRLSSLYELDKALDASTRRMKNLNLLGLGTKIVAASGRPEMVAAAGALQLLGSAFTKSGAAIGMNELSKLLEASATKGQIPLAALMDALLDAIRQTEGTE